MPGNSIHQSDNNNAGELARESIGTHRTVAANGISLHVVEAGPKEGPLVVLLHGFPEFWFAWRYQIPALAAAGYRVIAPDQRGYNTSDKPCGIGAYRIEALAQDVVGLINACGRETATVIGHDWGGIVAWWLGVRFSRHIEKLVVLNVPHPRVMRQQLLHNPRQRRRSRYVFWFQIPLLPEWRMRRHNWDMAVRALLHTSRPGTFTEADIACYREAWSQAGAMTAMINWYRAAVLLPPKVRSSMRVHKPVLLLWGSKDRFLGKEMARPSIDLCDNGQLHELEDATHWLQHEEPEAVNRLILNFLGSTQNQYNRITT